ncbi:COX assembly mitochondrial protein [Schizosaccharomyces pombe]|uniref:COX assembly mitochondrial protein 1 n=1 Tax=Schizosaccharomyces pombe (strain 972 / ATCC 24843) TaxID=284812 RepID=COXM1_SCHPO|nr:putative cytochrome c oxidase assembly protein Cmc1 [Schizosaccharomyces pombe]O74347.1 RecName: Full=COX assembly mitochondrial protein 1; AltName: Full=Cx9C motif-containing protein 1 [Schizosaccharomyces pombe 972h-]CAA20763.1 mitochondrial inner membrane protein involved in cytochrome oxidase biogenesis Cmc1 (predicted) [Schizosaccharomyces pombe]|eukprot:NP_596006.1 putative cytochrome c oxidase assembly protein Cmc1 [Schizosaccharomyces pombe]
MHPHLDVNNQKQCADLIRALEECHKSFGKFFGECNTIKYELKACLTKDRNDKARLNRENARMRKKVIEENRKKEEIEERILTDRILQQERKKSHANEGAGDNNN